MNEMNIVARVCGACHRAGRTPSREQVQAALSNIRTDVSGIDWAVICPYCGVGASADQTRHRKDTPETALPGGHTVKVVRVQVSARAMPVKKLWNRLQRLARAPTFQQAHELDAACYEASRKRWAGKSGREKARWVQKFAKQDLRVLDAEARAVLSYDLRTLASDVIPSRGVWGVRRRVGALATRELRTIHAGVQSGIAALSATALAHPAAVISDRRAGWILPVHRVRLMFLPPPAGAINNPTALTAIYEANDETSAIIARLGYLLLQEQWLLCRCGCGDTFPKQGKKQFATSACATRARQKKWREAQRARRERLRAIERTNQ